KIIPIFRRVSLSCLGDRVLRSTPFHTTLPEVGRSNKLMQRISVLFPAPLYPITPKISPFFSSRETFFNASTRPIFVTNVFDTFSNRIIILTLYKAAFWTDHQEGTTEPLKVSSTNCFTSSDW